MTEAVAPASIARDAADAVAAARAEDPSGEIAYAVSDLVKRYPGQTRAANDGINLEIRAGEIFGILGDNGAGKTTLVAQMVNVLKPTAGRIELFGQPVGESAWHVASNVGYMPQHGAALGNLTVGEALYVSAHLRGLSRADARAERRRLLDLWQLAHLERRAIRGLSGGEQRLTQVAIAMAGRLPVLVLDEPTANLDPQRRRLVWEVLSRENLEEGTTVIFITHDALEAEKVIQRVAIMREGRIVAVGRPARLKRVLGSRLRLELLFDPELRPPLPAHVRGHEQAPGRWSVLVERQDVGPLLSSLDLDAFDDLRLYSATLEDLFLHYAGDGAHPDA
jgi:ABC-2 type transport system ATP-binding protein